MNSPPLAVGFLINWVSDERLSIHEGPTLKWKITSLEVASLMAFVTFHSDFPGAGPCYSTFQCACRKTQSAQTNKVLGLYEQA